MSKRCRATGRAETAVIKENMLRCMIPSQAELSKRIGMCTPTMKCRFKTPEDFRLFELRAMQQELGMSYMDVLRIALGDGFDEKRFSREALGRYSLDFLKEVLKERG